MPVKNYDEVNREVSFFCVFVTKTGVISDDTLRDVACVSRESDNDNG